MGAAHDIRKRGGGRSERGGRRFGAAPRRFAVGGGGGGYGVGDGAMNRRGEGWEGGERGEDSGHFVRAPAPVKIALASMAEQILLKQFLTIRQNSFF